MSAAVSLTDALTTVAQQWEKAGNLRVELNFAASNILARQILEGAPVDVFISADEKQMNRLVESGAATGADVVPLLTNQLVVVTPVGRRVSGTLPAALADDAVKRIAIGDPQGVPAGVYAKAWLERANLWRQVEPKVVPSNSVRAALAAVDSDNADAGHRVSTDRRERSRGVTVPTKCRSPTRRRSSIPSVSSPGRHTPTWRACSWPTSRQRPHAPCSPTLASSRTTPPTRDDG